MKLAKNLTSFCLILVCAFTLSPAKAEQVVRVIGYTFPPFIQSKGDGGVTSDFLAFLNQNQSDYRFTLSKTSPNRRYRAIERREADMILFEMMEWGWKDQASKLTGSRTILKGGEVYIASKANGRNQSYFADIKSKRIAAVFGYHYGFAGFNNDREWLEKNFTISLTHEPSRVLSMVSQGRSDVGIVTESFLAQCLADNPNKFENLLISEKKDQEYRLKALVRNEAPITAETFNRLLEKLKAAGALRKFFSEKGLADHLVF